MKEPNMMRVSATRKHVFIVGAALFAAALGAGTFGAGALYARDTAALDDIDSAKVVEQILLTSPLAGEPGKEVTMAIYTFPPGASVPWHIHPDAQEFDYQLEGTLTVEVAGKPPLELKAGEAFHLQPNVVHRGQNKSMTETAKVYVVRTKPVDKPATELVDAPKDQ
jgi:quercetin dioxygenase-like cupin family protein